MLLNGVGLPSGGYNSGHTDLHQALVIVRAQEVGGTRNRLSINNTVQYTILKTLHGYLLLSIYQEQYYLGYENSHHYNFSYGTVRYR
jgi:hypothetical protein